jgi:nucleolar protein 56
MRVMIVLYPFGVVAFNEDKILVEKILFPKNPHAAAESMTKIESGDISEIKPLLTKLQTLGYDTFVFEIVDLAKQVQKKLDLNVEVAEASETEAFRARMEQVAVETGFAETAKDVAFWIRNVSMELTKLKIKGAAEKRDLVIAQAIQTLDDLDRTVNLFMGRLREWYGVHFPELDRLIEKHETYARLVMNLGYREHFTLETLENEGIPKERAETVAEVAKSSMGADLSEEDLAEIQALGRDVMNMYELRKEMENYIDRAMEDVAPNTRTIAGALLGARLIAIAGSLRNLAMRPASTIQVLGAEKALFRSLKTGARPPKHGLIFQHALLHDAKRWQRGKIARVIAGKLAIAARADAFGGKYVGDMLKAEVDHRIEEIREKYKEPPPLKEKKQMPERKEQRFERRDYRPSRQTERRGQPWRDRRNRNWSKEKRARKG